VIASKAPGGSSMYFNDFLYRFYNGHGLKRESWL
jgi:hypothetical protein